MADKLITSSMMMHKVTSFVDYNQLERLDTQLYESTY